VRERTGGENPEGGDSNCVASDSSVSTEASPGGPDKRGRWLVEWVTEGSDGVVLAGSCKQCWSQWLHPRLPEDGPGPFESSEGCVECEQ